MSSPAPFVRRRQVVTLVAILIVSFANLPGGTQPAQAVSTTIVIRQVYGGGSNAGAPYTHDFIELFNRGAARVSLAGWSVQYASTTGNFGSGSTLITPLSGSLAPGQYLLIQEAQGSGRNAPLPAPDVIDSTPINMSATGGKVALTNTTTPLGCNGGSTPCPPTALAAIVDLVGYDGATFFEGSGAAPAGSNTAAVLRASNGCTDTDNNAADFTTGAPIPRTTASPLNPCSIDAAPTVSGTTPAVGAADVAHDANISITFSEPVNVAGSWFTIACTSSGAHPATFSGGPAGFLLDPDADFSNNESCTVTILASQVTDQDSDDPPDNMVANYTFGFTTADVQICGDPATLIHTIQGSGTTSPINGTPDVIIEGVVVGDYQNISTELSGFYVREEDADADANPLTSEGIFVFDNNFGVDVNAGDVVRVHGKVSEFSSLTELNNVSGVQVCSSGASVTPPAVSLPVATLSDWERYEGMLVSFPQELTVTENFSLGRFGSVDLSGAGRLANPTNVSTPGAAAIALQDLNNRNRIILDDANNQQNTDPTRYPAGGLSASNTLRTGYTVNNLTGVLDQRFGPYRVQPVGPITVNVASNPRSAAPGPVGGTVKVASFNVLNYFNGDGLSGGFPTSRGADSSFEFNHQRDKIISAMSTMNADIVGLMEIENDAPPNSAIEDLVAGLNAAAGTEAYAFINTEIIGGDEIRVALIYKLVTVTPVGNYAILNSSVDPLFNDSKNRPSLAQTFARNATGARFTVVVSHLKSKGSGCDDVGDPDTGDGQGNCNLTRKNAAIALTNWLATDPTGSGDPDVLIIGDMNSYALEDPITAIKRAGYTNLIDSFLGAGTYSFVFQGQSGYLDHAFSSPGLTSQVAGVTEWHINADEPVVLDYNVELKSANQINTFYDPGPYRASDHDPVIVGLDLNAPLAVTRINLPYVANEGGLLPLAAPAGQ
ncbi:MAG: ExeM/NucH family extracellular endonuclease [Ardenticatenaceae bacterium]|nr:ExeM/NucH family extracellular endonuclease [Ardenticatenaceae bacterium]